MDNSLRIYLNGARVRLHNRRISFSTKDGGVLLRFLTLNKEKDTRPTCSYKMVRDAATASEIFISEEAMDALAYSWIEFRKSEYRSKEEKQKKVVLGE